MGLDPSKLTFPRQTDFLHVCEFCGICGPPTISITKGAIIANTEPGLVADANGSSLQNNTIAANRTGIIGVQPPASLGTNLSEMAEIGGLGSSEQSGLSMAANGTVGHFMRIPNIWDRRYDIYVRVIWCCASATDAEAATWKFLYTTYALEGGAITAPGAGALDTAIPADTVGAVLAYAPKATENGILNGGTIGDTHTYIALLVELDAETITGAVYLLGVEFEYTMRLGSQHGVKGKAWTAD